jgi:hypothetical protein
MGGKTDGRIVFDVLGGCPDGAMLETMLICDFGIGNIIRAEFKTEPITPPANPSRWLAIDIRSIACDHFEAISEDEDVRYVPCTGSSVRELKMGGAKSVRRIGFADIPALDEYVKDLSSIAQRYGKNVIAFDLRDPEWISTPGRNVVPADDPNSARRNEAEDMLSLMLVDSLGCHCIRTPSNIVGRGKDSDEMPRYGEGFYAYVKDCVKVIASRKPEASRKLRTLGLEIADHMDAARRAPFLSSVSFLENMEKEKESMDDWDEIIGMLRKKMAVAKSEILKAEIEGRIGAAWRERDDGKADLKKAVRLLRKSADSGSIWARRELLSALWAEGSPNSLLEMVSRAYSYSIEGDKDAMEFLGWAYEEGVGLPKNAAESRRWLAKAERKTETISLSE